VASEWWSSGIIGSIDLRFRSVVFVTVLAVVAAFPVVQQDVLRSCARHYIQSPVFVVRGAGDPHARIAGASEPLSVRFPTPLDSKRIRVSIPGQEGRDS
jgi:hypothetical protein